MIIRAVVSLLITFWFCSPAAAAPMAFRADQDQLSEVTRQILRDSRVFVYAQGEIGPGTTEAFLRFISQNQISHAIVYFDSLGGSLNEGVRLGLAIRRLGFDTAIGDGSAQTRSNAICASACAYAFAGGNARYFTDGSGRLGVHQFYATSGPNGLSTSDAQSVSGALLDYLTRMGVDAEAFVLATRASSSEMAWIPAADAVRLRLANNGIEPPRAEVRLIEGRAYLRIEQQREGSLAKLIVVCDGQQAFVMGGVITSEDGAQEAQEIHGVSYLELDDQELGRETGQEHFRRDGAVIWVERDFNQAAVTLLRRADRAGIWLENSSPLRWGAWIDLAPVRGQIAYYLDNCSSRGR